MSRDFVRRNPKLINDLTGQRFGRLIVDQISIVRGSKTGGSKHAPYWLCVCDCGNIARVLAHSLTHGNTRSCGCLHSETSRITGSRRGPDRKGGLNSSGYSQTWVDGRNVLVHRLVMEEILGRPLLPEETVHHVNGIRTDNLELWTSRHPKGQRIEDQVAWAVELLKLYAP